MFKKYLIWLIIGTVIIIGIVIMIISSGEALESNQNGSIKADNIKGIYSNNFNSAVNTSIDNNVINNYNSTDPVTADKSGNITSNEGQAKMAQNDINNVIDAAVGFKVLGDTVDYRTIDKGYRDNFLYYFSSGVNSEQLVDAWINEVKENNIVSEAKFVPDKSSVYMDPNYYTVVKGTFYIKYGAGTNAYYLDKKGLKAGKWYSREEEILFYIAVDGYKWKRSEWVFYKGYVLTEWRME